MLKFFKAKKKIQGLDDDPLVDPSSTPISKYKNRRRQITMNQANANLGSSADLDGNLINNKSSFLSNTGSMISSGINKLKHNQTSSDTFTSNNENQNGDSGWINDIWLHKNEQKDLENEERLIYNYFKKRVYRWSYFCLILAAYILLNVFIGFSSAPFYERYD